MDKANAIVLTFGSTWSDLFEASLARKLSKIEHIPLGSPRFKLTSELFEFLLSHYKEIPSDGIKKEIFGRLSSNSKQASEIEWKLDWFISRSSHLFIDSSMLDTAIGQHVLYQARVGKKPAWGISVDSQSSPLAAAFLKGIVFPSTIDDLVGLVLNNT